MSGIMNGGTEVYCSCSSSTLRLVFPRRSKLELQKHPHSRQGRRLIPAAVLFHVFGRHNEAVEMGQWRRLLGWGRCCPSKCLKNAPVGAIKSWEDCREVHDVLVTNGTIRFNVERKGATAEGAGSPCVFGSLFGEVYDRTMVGMSSCRRWYSSSQSGP